MSGEIIPFPPPAKKPGKEQQKSLVRKKSNFDIFADVTEEVLGEWQRYAVQDRLSEFVSLKLPAQLRGAITRNFSGDLNVISELEQKLGMKVAVFYPGCNPSNIYGWQAMFHRDKEIFGTPPDMASEATARALNVTLYITFIETLHSLGR